MCYAQSYYFWLDWQTFLIWQLIFSAIFLKRRYSPFQIIGCGLVFAGVILALTRFVAERTCDLSIFLPFAVDWVPYVGIKREATTMWSKSLQIFYHVSVC